MRNPKNRATSALVQAGGAALAVIATVALAGCSAISSGVITAKVHEPARTTIVLTSCGKGCLMPVTIYDDEDWRFDLRSGDETGWVYVTPEVFDSYELGDSYESPDR